MWCPDSWRSPKRKATMQGGNDARVDVEDLVKRAKEGHEASFAALYGHFFDRIFRYVSFKMGNSAEAEDITGEVFLKMLESIHSFNGRGIPSRPGCFALRITLSSTTSEKAARRRPFLWIIWLHQPERTPQTWTATWI